jgi:hypothetical protein
VARGFCASMLAPAMVVGPKGEFALGLRPRQARAVALPNRLLAHKPLGCLIILLLILDLIS